MFISSITQKCLFVQLRILSLNAKFSDKNSSGIFNENLLDDVCRNVSISEYSPLLFENSITMSLDVLHTIDIESLESGFSFKSIVGDVISFLNEYQKSELYHW